jgi:hypothetical protein
LHFRDAGKMVREGRKVIRELRIEGYWRERIEGERRKV